jgi:hypothetical protein
VARQEARTYGSVGLLVPPLLRRLVCDVTLNQQREKNVNVRDTSH